MATPPVSTFRVGMVHRVYVHTRMCLCASFCVWRLGLSCRPLAASQFRHGDCFERKQPVTLHFSSSPQRRGGGKLSANGSQVDLPVFVTDGGYFLGIELLRSGNSVRSSQSRGIPGTRATSMLCCQRGMLAKTDAQSCFVSSNYSGAYGRHARTPRTVRARL